MDEQADAADEVIECARAVEDAVRQLSRITVSRPDMTPADVDAVLAHLAAAVASLPQAAVQLSDILGNAKERYVLTADLLAQTQDPDLVIETARLHLDRARQPAISLHRLFDAAHNQTAHVAAEQRIAEDYSWMAPIITPVVRGPKDEPPPTAGGAPGPSAPR